MLHGVIDDVIGNRILGWVADRSQPNRKLELEIFRDGELLCTTTANQYRVDLVKAGIGDGHNAFHVAVPGITQECRVTVKAAEGVLLQYNGSWLVDLSPGKEEGFKTWDGIMPLPPLKLMEEVGGANLELFLVVADAWMQAMSPYLKPDSSVLDIGCGCGRTARILVPHPCVARYTGFDVVPDLISWCQANIQPFSGGRAHFHHYDLYSSEYNPAGSLRSQDLAFPCQSGTVDLIIAASLFTHLLEPDAAHYLNEVGRVISDRGHALLSILTTVPKGVMAAGTETRMNFRPSYFVEMASLAGLSLVRQMDDLCGQTVLVFSRNKG